MAKKSMIEREKKRLHLVNRFFKKRTELKNQINSLEFSEGELGELKESEKVDNIEEIAETFEIEGLEDFDEIISDLPSQEEKNENTNYLVEYNPYTILLAEGDGFTPDRIG